MKPDLIVTWPRHCDFPVWREQLEGHRPHVARILIAFSHHHEELDYRQWVRDTIPDALCFDAEGDGDWRDVAVNAALAHSDAGWVWFSEQDFFTPKPAMFWRAVRAALLQSPAAGWRADGPPRWHPSCLFVQRALVDACGGFASEGEDHFVAFSRRLDHLAHVQDLGTALRFGGLFDDADVFHMAGLASNHRLIDSGRFPEVYAPASMRAYLLHCLAVCRVREDWAERAKSYLDATVHPALLPE